jgi:hypothetical protein
MLEKITKLYEKEDISQQRRITRLFAKFLKKRVTEIMFNKKKD